MRLVVLLLLLIGTVSANSQTDSITYLNAGDTVLTSNNFRRGIGGSAYHEAPANAVFFVEVLWHHLEELYAYNPHVRQHYAPGNEVQIPLPLKAIVRVDPPTAMQPALAPVFYRVKKGDTVYGICHRYFEITPEWLLAKNPTAANGISPGMLLLIGWVTVYPIPSDWHEIKGGPYARMNHPLKLEYFHRSANRRITTEKGAATWPKDIPNDAGFYCLHRSAPINSIVEVYNPMSRQTIYLKVSGRLPEMVYDRNTLVVVSPLAAKALRVRDDRFYVHLKHY
ncbi:MAG: LysM domain-containing protein [Saprospiraceae bacterium]